MLIIRNADDLKRWVSDRYNYFFSPEVVYLQNPWLPCAYSCPENIVVEVEAIRKQADRPAWGQDWSGFLSGSSEVREKG